MLQRRVRHHLFNITSGWILRHLYLTSSSCDFYFFFFISQTLRGERVESQSNRLEYYENDLRI